MISNTSEVTHNWARELSVRHITDTCVITRAVSAGYVRRLGANEHKRNLD